MRVRQTIKNYYPAILIFVSLITFTFYTYHELAATRNARREKLFEQRVSGATDLLRKRIIDYVQILKGCQALFYASDSVTVDNWKEYVETLSLSVNYPGIQAVAYAAYIDKSLIPTVENEVRRSGYSEFEVKSNFQSDKLTPIIFIEPFRGRNLRAFGYDMYSETRRREAIDRALITGQPALTRLVTLVQETDEDIQPGFLLYLPVYRNHKAALTEQHRKKNIKGFVYSPFRAHDLMQVVFSRFTDLHIEIYDGNIAKSQNLLFKSNGGAYDLNAIKRRKETLMSDSTTYIAGTQWRMIVRPTDTFGSTVESREPALILAFGLSISILLALLSIHIIRNKTRAVEDLQLSREIETKKDEFISIASHELKTPLTSIKAYLQLLERGDLKNNEHNFVKKSLVQIKKLNNLIADLLDVSKIQAGSLQLNLSDFPLKELIYESIETVGHMYSSHEIILESEVPEVSLHGDKFRLEQALTNLLINGIKYSPRSTKVYVNAILDNNEVQITVKDSGIGISAESQKRIFEKFYRAEGLSSNLSGLGMGLFISHEIVSRHKGSIAVVSEVNKGSVFIIKLPYSHEII